MLERPAAMEDTAERMLANEDTFTNTKPLVSEDDRHVQSADIPIAVTLENESVWSRFHRLGTEMILTEQGRRMFPCCRFRLCGLDPNIRYFLIMDIAPLDEYRHRWNGVAWERDGAGEAHLQSPVCFHPDSPALGQRWMDGPVSFYKVKLTHSPLEPDAGVLLHPMHRYQPRLYVVPVTACLGRAVPLEGPVVHTFTFPQTEFYAVTSYQNPQITRLKINCNPFMLAFREDQSSARLIQSKLGLALSGRCPSQTPVSSLSGHDARKPLSRSAHASECTEAGVQSHRKRAACDEISSGERPIGPSARDEPAASLGSESAEDVTTLASSESSGPAGCPLMCDAPLSTAGGVKRVYHRSRCVRRARKAKAKWWSNVKYARAAAVSNSSGTDVSMQPDLEDVDGVLFVSFTAKEALDVHVGNMRSSPSSHTQNQMENSAHVRETQLSVADRISQHELTLLQHLKPLKNRQILHPALQQVGMKLSLLDPAAPIDLHYLGVHLPSPSPALSDSDKLTPSSGAPFVSHSGKTNDLTRIKGWMEKFSLTRESSAADSSANLSAFSSDVLDEYLEREGQQISERAAVFSASTPSPVVYQLPVKSSSYVRTLDSVLQTRGLPPNERPSKRPAKAPPAGSSSTRNTTQDHHPSVSSGGAPKVFSRRGRKRCRPQLRFNREAVDGSQSSTSAKKHTKLLTHEENAIIHGENPTYISTKRASFALNALLSTEKAMKTPQLSTQLADEDACGKASCRLGCVCDSLNRETRGSAHCRRVQCMFSCGCFKHKILLIRSPENSHTHNIRSLKAFHPGSDVRPEPALRITRLWERRPDEVEPEPLRTPTAARTPRRALCSHAHTPRIDAQTVEKDPVYLYLESMMTCARVREYNSNPPPQVHLLPAQKSSRGPNEATSDGFVLRLPEGALTPQSPDKSSAGEPEPTKVLEIISGCNWEAHRSLVLKQLFRYISTNHLSPVFCVDVYKVELLSKDFRKDANSSTLTYKVCVSLSEKLDKQKTKKREETPQLRSASFQKVNKRKDEHADENLELADTITPIRHFPLLSRAVPAGYLKANKKNLMRPGPIKVNGRTYNQAKLLLGRIGALHPANRLAAFVTGRIKPAPQISTQGGSVGRTIPVRTGCSNSSPAVDCSEHTVTHANWTKAAFRTPRAPDGISHPNGTTSPEPGRVWSAGAVLPASALPPGQQVVLQPVAGMTGVNMCQFNGQMIQLVPVPAAVPVHLQTGADGAGSAQQEPQTATQLPQTNLAPFILPRIHSVPGRTGFTLGSTATAHGAQNSLLSKNGTFSFRICPPTAESRTVGLEPTGKRQESIAAASTLLLPGGYKLIKLPMLVQPSVGFSSASHVMNRGTEEPKETPSEQPAGQQSSVCVKTESGETPEEDGPPLVIKVEPLSDSLQTRGSGCDRPDDGWHEKTPALIKVEPYDETSEVDRQPNDSQHPDTVRTEEEQETKADIRTSERSITDEGMSSAFSNHGLAVPSLCAQTKTAKERQEHKCDDSGHSFSKRRPEEMQKRIDWLWRRKQRVLSSDGSWQGGGEPTAGADDSSAVLMYSSDGWTTEDSSEWLSEDEVDVETFEEGDGIIGSLREKARRKTQQAAQRLRLSALRAAHHPVRLMSDLPLYKRTWRLNQALRERKRHAELQRSLDSLRRALCIGEHVTVGTDDLLRQACQTIEALEDHGRSLTARKRALALQHSHYQTTISQRSVAGTGLEAAAPSSPRGPSESTAHAHSANRASRLPGIVLQSFCKSAELLMERTDVILKSSSSPGP